ncbi:MAG: DUF397 domain-containing protein [Acidimicrobiales bacterium]
MTDHQPEPSQPTLAGLRWRTSSFSDGTGTCVAVAPVDDHHIAITNSTRPEDGMLVVRRTTFRKLISAAKHGDLDWGAGWGAERTHDPAPRLILHDTTPDGDGRSRS